MSDAAGGSERADAAEGPTARSASVQGVGVAAPGVARPGRAGEGSEGAFVRGDGVAGPGLGSRIVGRVEGRDFGPTVVFVAGMHGNEPAGLAAARALVERLAPMPVRGEVWAVGGNLGALREGRRYVDRDLNRRWTPASVEALLAADRAGLVGEDAEQRDLLEVLGPVLARAHGPVVFVDLHTMSGPGAPFVCMADVLRNRKVAFALPLPVVLGLEEVIEGSMLGYLCDLGHVGISVEGGHDGHPEAAHRLESAAWLVLVAAGALDPGAIPDLEAHRRRLEAAAEGLPGVLEIRHRHVCRDGDGFQMVPGLESFRPVRKGDRLARDVRGDIHAPQAGLLLLPRYQGTGDDGFFIARPVRRFWLDVSAHLRRARADRILPRLPGVVPHPELPETFLVDPRIARVKVADVFHLFGYRRIRREGHLLAFSRRRPDDRGPAALPAP